MEGGGGGGGGGIPALDVDATCGSGWAAGVSCNGA